MSIRNQEAIVRVAREAGLLPRPGATASVR